MIVFDLRCEQAHVFEAWFGTAADFEAQRGKGLVECPICASRRIEKAVMAPAVGAKGNRQTADSERKAQLARLAELQRRVEANCDYVGRDFATEVRRRHHRKAAAGEERGIFGEATLQDVSALLDDGIAVQPLPFRPRQTADA